MTNSGVSYLPTLDLSDPSLLLHRHTHTLPWVATVLYLVGVLYLLPRILTPLYVRHRAAYDRVIRSSKWFMVLWNMSLCVLSVLMLLGTLVPYVGHTIWVEYGGSYVATLCDARAVIFSEGGGGGGSSQVFWIYVFMLSKFVELGDTVLLVVKNPTRKVEFLHWFHHTTVLLFCWYAGYYKYAAGSNFVIMNSVIHTFMYYYYARAEMGTRPTWGKVLTTCQILQMVLGIIINSLFAVMHYTGGDTTCSCDNPSVIMAAAVVMYGIYLVLFVQFFYKKYFSGSTGKGKSKSAEKDKKN